MIERYLMSDIKNDLDEKMVFLGGPRQVGKTVLSLQFLNGDTDHNAYLNWDNIKSRRKLLNGELPTSEPFIILDEIHKYLKWRSMVKGFYDQYKFKKKFLVTGSARLDYYRKGGDSLQGRYHYHRLHPLSLYEINKTPSIHDLKYILKFGGFPEPFLKGTERHFNRWQNERAIRVIQEDLINLEKVKEISQLEALQALLPARVGSILSINSLREELSVKFETAERWVTIFENLYQCFRISPYLAKSSGARLAKKEKKLFLWDWSTLEDEGAKFENLVASNLLKYCHYHHDINGKKYDLKFIRDVEKREIDFVVVNDNKPLFAVECKLNEKSLSPHIEYFAKTTNIPYFYQVHMGEKDYEQPNFRARVLPYNTFIDILKI